MEKVRRGGKEGKRERKREKREIVVVQEWSEEYSRMREEVGQL